ncbi:PAN domain-containing protein 4 [Elsinoe australis]|uniref:PAN domain-containing protein 4 n=1 Tax=Elsinoe australis TaxID=40998 RepID=A0A4U7B4N5_9PEZI|nr:PAN domain-containing protein 4 [Elsinoe australis]
MAPSIRGFALLALVGYNAFEATAAPNPRNRAVKSRSSRSTSSYDSASWYTTEYVKTVTKWKTLMRSNSTITIASTEVVTGATSSPVSASPVTSVFVRSSSATLPSEQPTGSPSAVSSGAESGDKPSASQGGPQSSASVSSTSQPVQQNPSTASSEPAPSGAVSPPTSQSAGASGESTAYSEPSQPVVQPGSTEAQSSAGETSASSDSNIATSSRSVAHTTKKASTRSATTRKGATTSRKSPSQSTTSSWGGSPASPVIWPGSTSLSGDSSQSSGSTATKKSATGDSAATESGTRAQSASTSPQSEADKPVPKTAGASSPVVQPGATTVSGTAASPVATSGQPSQNSDAGNSAGTSVQSATGSSAAGEMTKSSTPSATQAKSGTATRSRSSRSKNRSRTRKTSKTSKVVASTTASTSSGSAPSFSPKSVTCPTDNGNLYTAANNRQYVVQCGVDHAGGNIGMAYVSSFQECIERCAANAKCVTVSLSGAACYLKDNVGMAMDNTVWSAREVSAADASSIENRPTPSPTSSGQGASSIAAPGGTRSCKNVASAGSSYTDAACGRQYTIACSSDLPGQGDYAAKYSQSFEGCFQYCGAESTCTAFSYFGGICYLKSLMGRDLNIVSPSGADIAYMSSAGTPAPTPAAGTTCRSLPSTYESTEDRKYKVKCGYDELGFSDIGSAFSRTFSACFALCDKFEKCVGFAYAAQTCYFKSAIGNTNENYNIDLAYLENVKPQKTTKSAKPSKTTAGSGSTASQDPRACSSLSDKGSTYQKGDGPTYQLYCGIDLYGGDYDTASSPTYEGCLDICTQQERCVAFAYLRDSQLCYLKSEVNMGRKSSGVDSASVVGLKPNIKPASSTGRSSTMFHTTPESARSSMSGSGSMAMTGPTLTAGLTSSASSSGASSGASSGTSPSGASSSGASPSVASSSGALPSGKSSSTSLFDVTSSNSQTFGASSTGASSSVTSSMSSAPASGSSSSSSISSPSKTTSSGATTSIAGARDCSDLGLTYQNGDGPEYDVHCNTDYVDGDFRNERSDSFEGCFGICTADAECVAFTYDEGSDICYLKNKALQTYQHAGVNSGSIKGGKKPSSSSSSSMSASVSTSASGLSMSSSVSTTSGQSSVSTSAGISITGSSRSASASLSTITNSAKGSSTTETQISSSFSSSSRTDSSTRNIGQSHFSGWQRIRLIHIGTLLTFSNERSRWFVDYRCTSFVIDSNDI